MPIKVENFDGVTAPALPGSPWVFASGLVTSSSPSGGITPISSPNVLALNTPGNNTHYFGVYGVTDGNGGNATVSGYFNAASTTANQTFGLFLRANATSISSTSGTYYWAQLSPNGLICRIYRVVSGSQTSVGSITLPSWTEPGWYLFNFTADDRASPNLSATVQRVSDSHWLNSSGVFQSGTATAVSATDTSITGAGYGGLTLQSHSDFACADNWTFDVATLPPLLLPDRPIIRDRDQRRFVHPRGQVGLSGVRVLVGGWAPTDPPIPSPRSGLVLSSPRRLSNGRLWFPTGSRPDPPPPALLYGIRVASGRILARGRIWMPVPTPAVSDQNQTPLRAAVRQIASPRILGRGTVRIVFPVRMAGPPPATPLTGLIVVRRPAIRERGPTAGRCWIAVPTPAVSDQRQTPLRATIVAVRSPRPSIRGLARTAVPSLAPPPIVIPFVRGITTASRRQRDEMARRSPSRAWRIFKVRLPFDTGDWYAVYDNTGAGDPVDYGTPLVHLQATTWTTSPLSPGTWKFGVRASNANGEEKNLDCAVLIVLDSLGNDITNRPMPSTGLRAFATAAGGIRVEWFYPPTRGAKAPTGFHVYQGTGGTPNYGEPVATVSYATGILNTFVANLSGLTGGTTYTIGVRAYNTVGEEANIATVSAAASTVGPDMIAGLTVIATV